VGGGRYSAVGSRPETASERKRRRRDGAGDGRASGSFWPCGLDLGVEVNRAALPTAISTTGGPFGCAQGRRRPPPRNEFGASDSAERRFGWRPSVEWCAGSGDHSHNRTDESATRPTITGRDACATRPATRRGGSADDHRQGHIRQAQCRRLCHQTNDHRQGRLCHQAFGVMLRRMGIRGEPVPPAPDQRPMFDLAICEVKDSASSGVSRKTKSGLAVQREASTCPALATADCGSNR
jgi:hypothetical protein